jgi:hypothetical protein
MSAYMPAALLLADTFHLSQNGIALFAMLGVAGAVSAPIAGRAADRGWSCPATGPAIVAAAGYLLLARLGLNGSRLAITALVAAAVLLDFGVMANGVLGQRAIHGLSAGVRSRFNGLYMATFFVGGPCRIGAGRLGLCPWRLVPDDMGRAMPSDAGSCWLPDRTTETHPGGDTP